MSEIFEANAPLVRWAKDDQSGAWHFLTIDGEIADAIRIAAISGPWLIRRAGFGSVKVEARIGATRWATSLFPHKSSGGWLLPVKLAVRRAETLTAGDVVAVTLRLLEA